jgi:molecular chaperone GrpE
MPVDTEASEETPSEAAETAEQVVDPTIQLREERDRLRDQLLRTAADFDNFRKRSRKELEDAEKRGREDTIREMLPVFDNLERAVTAGMTATDTAAIVDGLKMVMKLFEDQVQRIGISRVPSVGERFDPAIHDAIQQQETADHPPGVVIAEVVPGYRYGERLLRPAMVVVSRKPSASA